MNSCFTSEQGRWKPVKYVQDGSPRSDRLKVWSKPIRLFPLTNAKVPGICAVRPYNILEGASRELRWYRE